jgi:hypothetical protein
MRSFRHRKQRLRLRRNERVEQAFARPITFSLAFGCGLRFFRPLRGAQTGDCRPHGEGDDAEIDAERKKRVGIDRGPAVRGQSCFERKKETRKGEDAGQFRRPPR